MNKAFHASREQVRELDRIAIDKYGVCGQILMENAGHRCALAAAQMLGDTEGKTAVVLCGRGNNGGDGFVVARHLSNWGARVRVLLLAEIDEILRRGDETSINLEIVLNMEVPVAEGLTGEACRRELARCADADLLVDAMLGTGAHGEVR